MSSRVSVVRVRTAALALVSPWSSTQSTLCPSPLPPSIVRFAGDLFHTARIIGYREGVIALAAADHGVTQDRLDDDSRTRAAVDGRGARMGRFDDEVIGAETEFEVHFLEVVIR